MIVGAICMSHSPLMDRNRAPAALEEGYNIAIKSANSFIDQIAPDLTVIFYPDHLNGFAYRLLPPFCVGIAGTAIGDYGTAAGILDIPEDVAANCASFLLGKGVDAAVSYKLEVDHGATQPIELLSEARSLSRIIPVFVNCAAAPRPTFPRVRALGLAVGDWARARPERILIIGSGGLSHDPPIPQLADASPQVRTRLINGPELSYAQRVARQKLVYAESHKIIAGISESIPLNPEWDRKLLDAFCAGDLSVLDRTADEEISKVGGCGGHEVRTWIAALASLGPNYTADVLFYESINEWITGMSVLTARPKGQ